MWTAMTSSWHLDVDKFTNPITPRNSLHLLPRPLAHFLGYRDRPRREVGNVIVAVWALLGAFVGIAVIAASFMIPEIQRHAPPVVIASFGAAAVLEYNAIESPFSQPRNCILGNLFSATLGIAITKLFRLSSNFESLRWVAGGLGCGFASAIMTLTKTIYPPAGATALLASVDPQVEALGWYLIPLVMLSTILMLATSLLLNNIQRCYPMYWWTPEDLRKKPTEQKDIEKQEAKGPQAPSSSASSPTLADHADELKYPTIKINCEKISVPDDFSLTDEEEAILEILRNRLLEGIPSE